MSWVLWCLGWPCWLLGWVARRLMRWASLAAMLAVWMTLANSLGWIALEFVLTLAFNVPPELPSSIPHQRAAAAAALAHKYGAKP